MIRLGVYTCVVLCVLSIVCPAAGQDECKKINSCSCSSANGTIDLSPIAKGGSKAAFMDKADPSNSFFYSWNPCTDFTEGASVTTDCTNVAACQSDNTGQNYYNIGEQKSAKFVHDSSKGLTLQYTATSDITRTSIVTLQCDPNTEAELDVLGEDPNNQGTYLFTLKSRHCCASGGEGPGSGSLSIGSILVIAFIGICILYLVAGMLYMTFVRKASGMEKVPNFSMWTNILSLTKDGFIFTFTCGRRSGYGKV